MSIVYVCLIVNNCLRLIRQSCTQLVGFVFFVVPRIITFLLSPVTSRHADWACHRIAFERALTNPIGGCGWYRINQSGTGSSFGHAGYGHKVVGGGGVYVVRCICVRSELAAG